MSCPGTVYLVGAGPGAPDLLTVRAARLLERADVVFHDALVHPDTLALATRARKVAVGKRCSRISTDQRFINRSLVEAAQKHECVVRLKGGDPMLFGRAQEEIDALSAAGVSWEVVPGVTAALAAASQLGVSLTRRGVSRSVVLVTPRIGPDERDSDWAKSVAAADSAVLYMGVGQARDIVATLIAAGVRRDLPVAVVEGASLEGSREFRTTLAGLTQAGRWAVTGPAVILLGSVLQVREAFAFEPQGPIWSEARRAAGG
jgi:uroporphyrin-III C-methyltransferase